MAGYTVIAVSGKGGVGKSTFSALLIRTLRDRGSGAVLAVDADPNSCLPEYLGLEVDTTVGGIREDTLRNIADIPAGMTKERYLKFRMQECLVESSGIDLIVMGRQEGPGCYCYVNNLLRDHGDSLYRNYRYIVIDNEAGMEHLSRRTAGKIDSLLIVSDLSSAALKAAVRIRELSDDLGLSTRYTGLVLNRMNGDDEDKRYKYVEETGLKVAGKIPLDENFAEIGFSEDSLLDIPDGSPALKAVAEIVDTVGL